MALVDLLWEIPIGIVTFLGGVFFHELLHFVFGYLSGGNPNFSRYRFGVPTLVDYETPEAMSDKQVQFTAGIVMVAPFSILTIFALLNPLQIPGGFWLLLFLGGASWISWTDMFAMTHPGLWRKFTNGESISRGDLQSE